MWWETGLWDPKKLAKLSQKVIKGFSEGRFWAVLIGTNQAANHFEKADFSGN